MKFKLLALVLFLGCVPLDSKSTVVRKYTVPEHNETHWMKIGDISFPIFKKIPEEYFLEVQTEYEDGYKEKWSHKLPKTEWETYNLNDLYPHLERVE